MSVLKIEWKCFVQKKWHENYVENVKAIGWATVNAQLITILLAMALLYINTVYIIMDTFQVGLMQKCEPNARVHCHSAHFYSAQRITKRIIVTINNTSVKKYYYILIIVTFETVTPAAKCQQRIIYLRNEVKKIKMIIWWSILVELINSHEWALEEAVYDKLTRSETTNFSFVLLSSKAEMKEQNLE